MDLIETKRALFYKTYHPAFYNFLSHHKNHKNQKVSLVGYEFMIPMFFDKNPYQVFMKSTQNGQTEYLVNFVISEAVSGRGVFYVLPTFDLRNRFVGNRFNRTIDFTKYYKDLMKDKNTNISSADSTSLKHFGEGSIAFIGSNSSSAFTEFPADTVVVDELDKCDLRNVAMAKERLAASISPRIVKVSNPTIKEFGIDEEYSLSDQKKWYVKCESCNNWIHPDFFEHVVRDVGEGNYILRDEKYNKELERDIYPICNICGKPFNVRTSKGQWIAQNPSSKTSGYHINKLFSANVSIKELVAHFEKGLVNDTEMQRFYNADLGLAYTAKGAKIDYDMLDACRDDYFMPDKSGNPCVIGIDVGKVLHVIIAEVLPDKKLRVVFIGEVQTGDDLSELKDLFRRYKIVVGCIDAQPEETLSKKICGYKEMFRVYIKNPDRDVLNESTKTLTINRTVSLDTVKEEILLRNIILPKNAHELNPLGNNGKSQFYNMMCNSVRIYDEEKEKYKWVEGSKPDHYLFAMNFMLAARKILASVSK